MRPTIRPALLSIACAAAVSSSAGAAAQAIHPVLDAKNGFLLGAPVNGTWRDGKAISRQVRAGRRYRVFGPAGELGTSTGGRAESIDEPCPETFHVELTPAREAGEIAVDGTWNASPRPVTRIGPRFAATAYGGAVREILARHGIRNPDPRVTGAVRVDLDGDGTEEVIVTAHRQTADGTFHVGAGDYDIAFVRKLVNGAVRTIMLEEEYHPRATGSTPNEYTIAGAWDLYGDGRMEIVIRGHYYEGGWTTLYRLTGTTARELVSVGCGS